MKYSAIDFIEPKNRKKWIEARDKILAPEDAKTLIEDIDCILNPFRIRKINKKVER